MLILDSLVTVVVRAYSLVLRLTNLSPRTYEPRLCTLYPADSNACSMCVVFFSLNAKTSCGSITRFANHGHKTCIKIGINLHQKNAASFERRKQENVSLFKVWPKVACRWSDSVLSTHCTSRQAAGRRPSSEYQESIKRWWFSLFF